MSSHLGNISQSKKNKKHKMFKKTKIKTCWDWNSCDKILHISWLQLLPFFLAPILLCAKENIILWHEKRKHVYQWFKTHHSSKKGVYWLRLGLIRECWVCFLLLFFLPHSTFISRLAYYVFESKSNVGSICLVTSSVPAFAGVVAQTKCLLLPIKL